MANLIIRPELAERIEALATERGRLAQEIVDQILAEKVKQLETPINNAPTYRGSSAPSKMWEGIASD